MAREIVKPGEASAQIMPVADADITRSQAYQESLARCREICESLRRDLVEHYWNLGQEISACLGAGREEWGARIISLEADLGIDRATLWRAVQLYQTFRLADLTRPGRLTWGKLRLLLPISPDLRAEILAQIESGDLRTTDDVRIAIIRLRQQRGELLAPAAREDQLALFGLHGITAERIAKAWTHAQPQQRAALMRSIFIPSLGLEEMPRKQALSEIRELKKDLEAYERRLSGDDS
jgi:hypothetical protein